MGNKISNEQIDRGQKYCREQVKIYKYHSDLIGMYYFERFVNALEVMREPEKRGGND